MKTTATLGGLGGTLTCVAMALGVAGACGSSGGQSGTDESGLGQSDPQPPFEPAFPSEPVLPLEPAGGITTRSCTDLGQLEDGSVSIQAREVNDYAFQSTLSLETVVVADDPAALGFGWGAVRTDFHGHPVDPVEDIDMVTLFLWSLDQTALQEKLNADALAQNELVAMAMIYTNDRAIGGAYYDFTSFGTPIERVDLDAYLDPTTYPQDRYTYTVMAASGTTAGQGARMMKAFRVDPRSNTTQVELGPSSTRLSYAVDLRSHERTPVPLSNPNLTMDWTEMTVNAMGREFRPSAITEVVVANYADSVEDLERRFLDLQRIADRKYRGSVAAGTNLNFQALTDDEGTPFAGFDDEGTWLVALFCGSCSNPAPWYLTVVTPCAE